MKIRDFLLNYQQLRALTINPNVMWAIAIITAIFIFKLFVKLRLLTAIDQIGSSPTEYTQLFLKEAAPFDIL